MEVELPERYEPLEALGKGAMGQVLLARDRELQRTVAIKLLAPHYLDNEVVASRFEREARIQAKLEHPNVVTLYDCRLDAVPPYLVMEYVQGEDLDALLKREGALPFDRVLALAAGVGGALDALHRQGVVHRDLKPSNIMVRAEDGRALVMDLGLAQADDQTVLTQTGQLVGTPYYFPPEVARGEEWGPAGDLYQLGAIVYECVAGQRLVGPGALTEVLGRIMAGHHRPLPEEVAVPPEAREALARMVAPDPAERFASGEDFARALAGEEVEEEEGPPAAARPASPAPAGSGGTTVAVPPLAEPRSTGSGRRIPGLVFLAALVGLGWSLTGGRGAPEDVRFRVLGDALVASFLAERSEAVRLEVDGEVVPTQAELRGDRRRLVYRPLPAEGEVRAALVWPGGRGAQGRFRADGPAVGERVLLAAGRKVLLEVERPCTVFWETAREDGRALEPGERALALPPGENSSLTLVVAEEGVSTRRTLTRRALLEESVARWNDLLAGLDARELLTRTPPHEELAREQIERAHAVFTEAGEWLPRALGADLPVEGRRRLGDAWHEVQWALSLDAYLDGLPADLALPDGEIGSRFRGFPPWGALVVERNPRLAPVGGRDHDPQAHSYQLKSQGHRLILDGPFATAADALRFRWPEDAPPTGPVCLSIRVGAMPPEAMLELLSEGEERVQLRLWNPAPAPRDGPKTSGWLSVVLPADLGVAPGEGARLRLRGIRNRGALLTWIERVRISWRS